jgi:hypothetical protein
VDNNDNELKHEALLSLLSIAKTQHQQILDYTVPVLMSALPSSAADSAWASHRKNLDTLAELSSLSAIFDVTGPQLISKFETATRQLPNDSLYAHAIIDTFYNILKLKTEDIGKWIDLVFEKLIVECIVVSLANESNSSILADHIMSVIAAIVATVFQHLDAT